MFYWTTKFIFGNEFFSDNRIFFTNSYGPYSFAALVFVAAMSTSDTTVVPKLLLPVREICIIVHVGGTRGVTSSTDHYMKIHARITLSVEFIRTCIFLFLCYV
jgi:hypothetical protein